MTATQIAALPSIGVIGVAATGTGVAVSVAQALALEGDSFKLTVPSGDKATISDLAANIAALTAAQIAALPAAGISGVTAIDASVALSVAQALALEGDKIAVTAPTGDAVTISDLAASIAALTTTQIAALQVAGISAIAASNASVALSVAQAIALETAKIGVSAPAGDVVSLSDTAADIQKLTAAQIAGLSPLHVTQISASDTNVALSVAQAAALETAGITIGAPTGSKVTLSDTAANLETLTAAEIAALPALGVGELYSSNTNVSYSAAQTSAILSSGLAVAATGSDTVTENFASGDDLVYSNGLLIQQKTTNADGSYDIAYTNVTGQTYSSYENIYNSVGTRFAEASDYLSGSGGITLYGADATITSASGADSVTTGTDTFALNPHSVETVTATGTTSDVFVYSPGFGQEALSGFATTGAGHDLLQFNASSFNYLSPGESQASDLAAVLLHATQAASGAAVITDSYGDSLTLNAVTKAALTANAADFKFV